jgi:hypothetical protein
VLPRANRSLEQGTQHERQNESEDQTKHDREYDESIVLCSVENLAVCSE